MDRVVGRGEVSQGAFVLEVIRGAKAGGAPWDIAYLEAKADLGVSYAAINGLSDVADARDVMARFGDQATSNTAAALSAVSRHYADASASDSGEMIMQLVGVVNDPFLHV